MNSLYRALSCDCFVSTAVQGPEPVQAVQSVIQHHPLSPRRSGHVVYITAQHLTLGLHPAGTVTVIQCIFESFHNQLHMFHHYTINNYFPTPYATCYLKPMQYSSTILNIKYIWILVSFNNLIMKLWLSLHFTFNCHRDWWSIWTRGHCLPQVPWSTPLVPVWGPTSYCHLEQQIAVAVQRGNAAVVLGTAKPATQAWLRSVVVIVLVTVHIIHVI